MAKKYIFVRMPEDVFKIYKGIQVKMQTDISRVVGKPVKLTMPKVFRAVASPEFNENFIQVDLKKMAKLSKVVKAQ
jgi:hypothetical protein